MSGRVWWRRGVEAGLGAAALGALLLAPVSTVRVEQQVDRRDALATLGEGRFGQTFRSEAPGLTQIDLVATSRNRPAPIARFRLREAPGGPELVSQTLPRRLPPAGHEYVPVRFIPLVDSGVRTYEFSVEREGPPDPSQLRLWGSRGAPHGRGGFMRDGVSAGGDLAYRAWHRVSGWTAVRALRERLAWSPLGPWGGWAAAVVVTAYGVGLGALVVRLRRDPGDGA